MDWSKAERAEQHAARHGAEQAGKRADHIDDRVAAQQHPRPGQKRDARLHGGLVGAGDAVEQHQRGGHQRHERDAPEREIKHGDQKCGAGVQQNHDVPLIDAVGDHAAEQGKDDHRDERAGRHRAEQRGGAGFAQQVERQCEAQDGVAEQGDDLPDDDEREIAAEQARFFRLWGKGAFRADAAACVHKVFLHLCAIGWFCGGEMPEAAGGFSAAIFF